MGGQTVLRSDCVKFSPLTSHSQSLSEPISPPRLESVGNFPPSPHWLVRSNYWKTVIWSEEIQIFISYSNLGELSQYGRYEGGITLPPGDIKWRRKVSLAGYLSDWCDVITRLTPRWEYNGEYEAGNAEWWWLCPPAHLECFISFLTCNNWWRDKIVWAGVQLDISRPSELMKDFYREILY